MNRALMDAHMYRYQTAARALLTPDQLRSAFSKVAVHYRYLWQRRLPAARDAVFFDAACGYGNWLYFLRSLGYFNIRGCDSDAGQVALARSLSLPAEVGNAIDVLAEVGPLHCISALDFIEHVAPDDLHEFLELSYRRLLPGGILCLRTPSADGLRGSHDRYNDLTHQIGFSSNALKVTLESYQFSRVEVFEDRSFAWGFRGMVRALALHCSRSLLGVLLQSAGAGKPRIWSPSMWAYAVRE